MVSTRIAGTGPFILANQYQQHNFEDLDEMFLLNIQLFFL